MAMGINLYNANLNSSIIDRAVVKEVTENIFSRTQVNNGTDISEKFDLSKFNRASLGVDLYSGKVNTQQANQIALRSSGLDIQLNQNFAANIQYLNTQAALNSTQQYQKNIDGKMPVLPTSEEKHTVKNNFAMPKTFDIASMAQTSKDKRGSNPFSMLAAAKSDAKEAKENKDLNIFA